MVSAVCVCVSFLLHRCSTHSAVELDLSDSHKLSACTVTAATKTRGICSLPLGLRCSSHLRTLAARITPPPLFTFCCSDHTTTKSNLGRKGFVLFYTSRWQRLITEGSQGSSRQELKQRQGLLTSLLPQLAWLSQLLLSSTGPTCLRVALLPEGWVLHTN